MRGIEFLRLGDEETGGGYAAPGCHLEGQARSVLAGPTGFPLWVVRAELAAGARLCWEGPHGDEGLYPIDGDLSVDGRTCPAGGVVVVEAGAAATVSAPRGARLLHFGPHDHQAPSTGWYGPPAAGPRGVHVVGPGGLYAAHEPGRDTRMFADSSCATCRITLFFTGRDTAYAAAPHSHSTDEILYLLAGEVRFGSHRLGPGDAAFIEGGRRYAFRSGPDGFAFLNYRRDASEQTVVGDVARLEGGEARGLDRVWDVR